MKQVAILIGGALVSWIVLLGLGWLIQGEEALLHSAVALGICLVPAVATLLWTFKPGASPDMIVAVLGGTGVRLAAVLGGGFLLRYAWPALFPESFWIWVGVFYMITLSLEVALVVRLKRDSSPA